MRNLLVSLLVAVAVAVAVGLLTGAGWPGFLMGAVWALSLWVMLFFGSYATPRRGYVQPAVYAAAAAAAVALGFVFFRTGDGNAAWWAPAFIMAGAVFPAAWTAAKAGPSGSHGRDG